MKRKEFNTNLRAIRDSSKGILTIETKVDGQSNEKRTRPNLIKILRCTKFSLAISCENYMPCRRICYKVYSILSISTPAIAQHRIAREVILM